MVGRVPSDGAKTLGTGAQPVAVAPNIKISSALVIVQTVAALLIVTQPSMSVDEQKMFRRFLG